MVSYSPSIATMAISCIVCEIDKVDKVQYTFHADNIGHFSLIDHMLVSECLVHDHQSVIIHVDDSNWSDHYAISCLVHTA